MGNSLDTRIQRGFRYAEMGKQLGPYVTRAIRYARDVLEGTIPTCRETQLACERQLRDLTRRNSEYSFDITKANKACAFIERMPHPKGHWAAKGETIRLEPWQCFIVTTLFGWVATKDIVDADGEIMIPAGCRRFREAYIEVARKNAKSTLAAAIGLYLLAEDEEWGADIYCGATSHKQANDAVFAAAKSMAKRAKGFSDWYGIVPYKYSIARIATESKFEPLHARGDSLDGLNAHGSILDELHAHKRRDLYDVLVTATGSRTQPLTLSITTAGTDTTGICYEVRDYTIKVLNRALTDDQRFGIIYKVDDKDDWTSREVWRKANPNYGVSVFPMQLETEYRKARANPAAQNTFLTKHLSMWCNAATAWMDMILWNACADPNLKLEDFKGEECWPGTDLSSKIDITAVMPCFKRLDENNKLHIYAFGRYYLPEKTIEESPNSQYQGWARAEHLRATPGNIIDMEQIERDTVELGNLVDIIEIPVDPMHNATQFKIHMEDEGFECVDVRPTVFNFSEPMKWLFALVKDGRFHHNGDPVLTWMASNVHAQVRHTDEIYPKRDREHAKIDGVVGILMSMARMLIAERDRVTVYDKGQGVRTV